MTLSISPALLQVNVNTGGAEERDETLPAPTHHVVSWTTQEIAGAGHGIVALLALEETPTLCRVEVVVTGTAAQHDVGGSF
jgi:hypothetical protein